MNYDLIKDILNLIQQFEYENKESNYYESSVKGFRNWISATNNEVVIEPFWVGKENGRSADSVINTLIVHLNRYAKRYSKSAILGSDFSTQEDFIYLITLNAFGKMSKMDLIKKNVHEKPVGMQIIKRLLNQGWVEQQNSKSDKRSKVISITQRGIESLELQMDKIRKASSIVTGNLTYPEKMVLINLLSKLEEFHLTIYNKNMVSENLIEEVLKTFKK